MNPADITNTIVVPSERLAELFTKTEAYGVLAAVFVFMVFMFIVFMSTLSRRQASYEKLANKLSDEFKGAVTKENTQHRKDFQDLLSDKDEQIERLARGKDKQISELVDAKDAMFRDLNQQLRDVAQKHSEQLDRRFDQYRDGFSQVTVPMNMMTARLEVIETILETLRQDLNRVRGVGDNQGGLGE